MDVNRYRRQSRWPSPFFCFHTMPLCTLSVPHATTPCWFRSQERAFDSHSASLHYSFFPSPRTSLKCSFLRPFIRSSVPPSHLSTPALPSSCRGCRCWWFKPSREEQNEAEGWKISKSIWKSVAETPIECKSLEVSAHPLKLKIEEAWALNAVYPYKARNVGRSLGISSPQKGRPLQET